MPLFLSCSDTNNPFTAANATISIVLVSSSGQRSANIIADSVDKIVRIGVSAYLPKYIDSVFVVIAKSAPDTDTVFTFGKSTIWTDTQWKEITFLSAGARTVSAVALIQGAPPYSLTAGINIAGKPVQTYTVAYNGNGNTGGIVPADGNAYVQGASVTVKANIGALVRTGYTFAGWNTAVDGSGASYAGGEIFNIGMANVMLYAKWTQNIGYTVIYDGNGNTTGTVPTDANVYGPNSSVTVKTNTGNLVKSGFTFAGWNTSADGSGTSYAGGATFTMGTANITLYAKWTIGIYTVKFNSNGGSAVDSQNVTYNTTANAPTPPTQNGFIFSGWYSDQALTIQFNFLTPITSSITLYAKWTPVYTVTYLPNVNTSGTVPVDTIKYTNGATVTVLDNTGSLTKTGYTFSGWNTNSTGTGTDRTPGSTFAMGSTNVTLYTKWVANKYTVKFNSNGGSMVDSQLVDYGAFAAAPTPPTKISYVFARWCSSSALTDTFQFSTPIITNKTLYAKWEIRDADGNVYTEVKIGNQVWMVENLKTTKYKDGTNIPIMTPDSVFWTPGYCWYNDSVKYKDPYGALYSGYTINTGKLAPAGWHIPSDAEWATLISYLNGPANAGGLLKEPGTAHWADPNNTTVNTSGFAAMGTGYRMYYASGFYEFHTTGKWWSSTSTNIDNNGCITLTNTDESVVQTTAVNNFGFSVRCIRDY